VSIKLQSPETYHVGISNPSTPTVIFGGGAGGTTQGGEVADAPYYNLIQTFGSTNTTMQIKLSTARAALGGAVVGDLAVFAGGQVNNSAGLYTDVVDLISLGNGVQTTARLSEPRGYLTGASTSKSVYFVGGYKNNGMRSTVVDQYNTGTKKWSTTQLPVGRSNHSSIGLKDYVFIAGGILDTDPPLWTDLIDIIQEDPTTGNVKFLDSLEMFGNRSNMASAFLSYGGQSIGFFCRW